MLEFPTFYGYYHWQCGIPAMEKLQKKFPLLTPGLITRPERKIFENKVNNLTFK
jgi:hypothetical protein